MDPIAVLFDRDHGGGEGRLAAFASPDNPGRVILDYVGPPADEFVMSAGDARRLMYQLSCASIKAMDLAREAARAEERYAHE